MTIRRGAFGLLLAALLAAGLASGIAIASSGTATKTPTVKKVYNAALGKTILVTGTGFALYTNTKERTGKIRCVGQCRSFWPPLLVAGTAKPTAGAGVAVARLGTIKRPDGGRQVTYKGVPLYRFKSDKRGQATGQGFKDLGGTWSVVALAATGAPPPPPPATTATTSTTYTNPNPYP